MDSELDYLEPPSTPVLPEPSNLVDTVGGHKDKFSFTSDYKYVLKQAKKEEVESYHIINTEVEDQLV